MTSTETEPPGSPPRGGGPAHVWVRFTAAMHEAADRVDGMSVLSMSDEEVAATTLELTRLEARIGELRLRMVATAEERDVGKADASPSTGAWLAHHTRQRRSGAFADVRFAQALDGEFTATRAALSAGRVLVEQARVIVKAVADLPSSVSGEDRRRGEAHLLELASEFDAQALAALGRHLLEVLDPEEAERRWGEKLARQEREAARKVFLSLFDNGDGTTSGRFKIPALAGQMLHKMLDALAAPRHTRAKTRVMHPDRHPLGADGWQHPHTDHPDHASSGSAEPGEGDQAEREWVSRPETLGRAFVELIEGYPLDRLPKAGGVNATVVVIMTLEQLLGELDGVCLLDTGSQVSAALARRLACEAGVIPAVLGSQSQVLDLGQKVRLFSDKQRIALGLRDNGCTAEGCPRPPAACEAHHKKRWSDGGPTDVANGTLLCPWHHHRAHDPHYRVEYLPTGKTRFHRRT